MASVNNPGSTPVYQETEPGKASKTLIFLLDCVPWKATMSSAEDRVCPGCGLQMPLSHSAVYDGYFNTSPECWSVFTEVLASEFGNAVLFGRVHQLTVDTYAVQHAGGLHPDKSVAVHLSGLHLALERGVPPVQVAPLLQRIAAGVNVWPHLEPPQNSGPITIFDVALASSMEDHMAAVRKWARQVWSAWSAAHEQIAAFVDRHLPRENANGQ